MSLRTAFSRPLRYGQVSGQSCNRPFECSASIVFSNVSGRFVTLDSSEQLVIGVAATTELIGAVVQGGAYTGPSTAGRIEVTVNMALDAVYLLPIAVSSVAASRTETQLKDLVGKTCDLAVASSIQYAEVDLSTRDVIQIVDYVVWGTGIGDQAVMVRLVPSKIGATGVI
jgi:hypothetical protein